LTGLLGDSDREGRRRLYFNTRLDYYAEFAESDVVAVESVAADQPPFVGLDATRVSLRRDARVDFVHSQVNASDPFDLDARRRQAAVPLRMAETWEAECPGPSFGGGCETDFACGTDNECPTGWGTVCKPATCLCPSVQDDCETRFEATCRTCGGATCRTCNQATCRTCGQATCQTCNQATCQTCNQATCQTCGQATCRTCNQATCRTCVTCRGATCVTCDDFGCNPTFAQTHCFTCRAGCERP
jgi:hypothetical protein